MHDMVRNNFSSVVRKDFDVVEDNLTHKTHDGKELVDSEDNSDRVIHAVVEEDNDVHEEAVHEVHEVDTLLVVVDKNHEVEELHMHHDVLEVMAIILDDSTGTHAMILEIQKQDAAAVICKDFMLCFCSMSE